MHFKNVAFEIPENNLDAPVKELICELCKLANSPAWQIRLSAEECGQSTAIIGWQCSLCGWKYNQTPDDLEILDAEVIL